jgi:hypothetical protein
VNTTRSNMRLLIWSGPVSILLAVIGWVVLCGFLPPPSPSLSPAGVSALWSDHTNLKRLGLTLCFWGGPLYATFSCAISWVLRRDSKRNHGLATAQLALGIYGTIFVTLNFLILLTVAFRPDRDAQSLQVMHDLGFIMTVMPAAPFTFQYILIGIAILQSPAEDQFFPRWVAYLNFWVALLFLPAAAVPFFKTGPLAWNGLLGFWIPGIAFALWVPIMFWVMNAGLNRWQPPADAEDEARAPALVG